MRSPLVDWALSLSDEEARDPRNWHELHYARDDAEMDGLHEEAAIILAKQKRAGAWPL